MAAHGEEDLLCSVALQNAQSILAARQRAEEALRRQTEWLRITLASIGDAVISTDSAGQVTFLNAVAERLTGWPQAEAVGRPLPEIFRIVHERTRQPADNPALRALREGTIVGLANHTVLIARDGSERPIDDSAAPMRDETGATVGAVLVFRDISERKQAEEAMARLAAIVASSEDAIVSKTLDSIIRTWNAGAERLFGYTAAEAVGQSILLIIPPERHAEERMILDHLCRGERIESFETVRVAKDGRRIDISLTVSPLRDSDGQVSGVSKIARDITAQKRLLEHEREQARLLREVAAAALTIHSAGSLGSILGVVAGEARRILGTHQGDASLAPDDAEPRERPAEAAALLADLAQEVCRTNWPVRLTPAELTNHAAARGLPVPAAPTGWLAAPFVGRGGRNLGLVHVAGKTAGEFTESDEAILVQLAHIAAVAIENARLNCELRDQDRRKDEFLALLAHELRNPLAPLRNGLQVLRLAGATSEAGDHARAMMERQLGHMVRLIDDLLDVSRISRNKMELRRSWVPLADIIGSAVETARPMMEAAGHELTVALPPEPVYLDADLTRLAQVFGNLLTNSAKYTEPGGRVWLRARRDGAQVAVDVQDTGIGIPVEAQPTIFDMFSQVDRSIERSTGGLGIGLALVKGLVEMHGGTVSVASAGPGQGSTFTVRLPLAPARPEPAAASAGAPAAGAQRRILVVDDNHDAAQSMAMMLQLLGNVVRTAHDGLAAVEAAEQLRPDVILMDLGMPRLNGLDATRLIRAQPWGTGVTIIALTGWGQEVDRKQSRLAGCDGHLVKPVSLPDLENLLAELTPTAQG